jgi:hypothetical protein
MPRNGRKSKPRAVSVQFGPDYTIRSIRPGIVLSRAGQWDAWYEDFEYVMRDLLQVWEHINPQLQELWSERRYTLFGLRNEDT